MPEQLFKTVYYPDHPAESSSRKNVKIAFSKKDISLYRKIAHLSSEDMRSFLGHKSYHTLKESAASEYLPVNTYCRRILRRKVEDNLVRDGQLIFPNVIVDAVGATFKGGVVEPLHTWFPFLEGYSPRFVEQILDHFAPEASRVFDPFAGMGTTPLVASRRGLHAYYCEINPLLQFIIQAKVDALTLSQNVRARVREALARYHDNLELNILSSHRDAQLELAYKKVFGDSVFFDPNILEQISRARNWIDSVSCSNPLAARLLCVAILSSLLPVSRMIRAGDMRYKTPKEMHRATPSFINSIQSQLRRIMEDINKLELLQLPPALVAEDARNIRRLPPLKLDVVITSPPYLNGTNYFRNTKIELWFLRCLGHADDLRVFRAKSVVAGINDVTSSRPRLDHHSALRDTIESLKRQAYDSRIPKMVGGYFYDLDFLFEGLTRHLITGATVAIDIGDSCYGEVHVPTDRILTAILSEKGFSPQYEVVLRRRLSRSEERLKQVLLVFKYEGKGAKLPKPDTSWRIEWSRFKRKLPHQKPPFSKRNWGHPLHSLCSYGGKMKPSLAHFLVKTFLPRKGRLLDPFAGVGTIPFEGVLAGHTVYGFEISPAALYIAAAKLGNPDPQKCETLISELEAYLKVHKPSGAELASAARIRFNKSIRDYYHSKTLREVLLARRYFREHPPISTSQSLVLACLLHILHGNRPYALSRWSHNTTPFSPRGSFEHRSLLPRLRDKVKRSLAVAYPSEFVEGRMFHQDATSWWPQEISDLDAIITSPPFFDSTRFYLSNWLRLWFCGWERQDFDAKSLIFLDERQKEGFSVYQSVFRQARERLKTGAVLVFHLGKSRKSDMARELSREARHWFRTIDVFSEDVGHCETHGIRDKGTVFAHQFLVLQ